MNAELWMVEKFDGIEWVAEPVWASRDRAVCHDTIAGLVRNACYKRSRLRVKLWSRGRPPAPQKGGTK